MNVYMTTKEYRKSGKMAFPYMFLISGYGGAPYRAFLKPLSFKKWMRERGLRMVKIGQRHAKIEGEFKTVYTKDLPQGGLKTMVLHNGSYVPCVIKDCIEYVYHTGIAESDWSPLAVEKRLKEFRELDSVYG